MTTCALMRPVLAIITVLAAVRPNGTFSYDYYGGDIRKTNVDAPTIVNVPTNVDVPTNDIFLATVGVSFPYIKSIFCKLKDKCMF